MKGESNAFLIYQDDNGVSNVNVRFEGEDVWLAAEQLAELFQTTQQNISLHVQSMALLQIVENRFAPRRPTLIQRGILGSPAAGWAPRRCWVA